MHQMLSIKRWFVFLLLTAFCGINTTTAQIIRSVEDTTSYTNEEVGVFPKAPNSELYNFKISGFYRFFSTYLNFKDRYITFENEGEPDNPTRIDEKVYFIGDDQFLPNLQLNISGRPSDKASWGFDVYAFQLLNGLVGTTYGRQVIDTLRPSIIEPLGGIRLGGNLNLQLGINMYGSYASPIGNFDIKAGGIHWTSISDLTMATNPGYNRFMLSERNPWDPLSARLSNRYSIYHSVGEINQDERWGEQAFSGIIIDGNDMPGQLSMRFMYGKTALDGGFFAVPNLSYGGRLRKNFTKGGFVGFNTFHNRTFADSLGNALIGFNVLTGEVSQRILRDQLHIHAEVGMGRYIRAGDRLEWGEVADLRIQTKKQLTGIPITARLYRISENVVNNNAIFNNTFLQQAARASEDDDFVDPNDLVPFASAIINMGGSTNNRQAIELNAEKAIGDLSVIAGISYGAELAADSNLISFGHPVNALTRARFWRWTFPTDVGPYGRQNKVFRGTYELAGVYDGTDTTTRNRAFNKKQFNNIELQLKYKTKIFGKALYAFYLGRMATAQDFFAAIIPYDDRAYIRQMSNEAELYYELNSKLVLSTYFGLEHTAGNEFTDLDEDTGKPRNQFGRGFGVGADFSISTNAAFFIRHKWAFYEDENFPRDKYNLQETLVELKIQF